MRPGWSLSSLLFDTVPKALAIASRQEKDIKGTIEKEEAKLSLFEYDIIIYLKDPIESTRKLMGLINTCSKIAKYNHPPKKTLNLYFYMQPIL